MSLVSDNLAKIRFWCDKNRFASPVNENKNRDLAQMATVAIPALTPLMACVATAGNFIAQNPELMTKIFEGSTVTGFSMIAAHAAMKLLASDNFNVESGAKFAEDKARLGLDLNSSDKMNMQMNSMYQNLFQDLAAKQKKSDSLSMS